MVRRRLHAVAIAGIVVIVSASSGCFKRWGNSAADGALDAFRDRSSEILLPVGDTVFAMVNRFYDDSLRPRVEATTASLLNGVEERLDRTEDSLAQFVGDSSTKPSAVSWTTTSVLSGILFVGRWVSGPARWPGAPRQI